jgi:hypothetical protein
VSFHRWLNFVAAFMIIVGLLSVGVGIAEWWRWRKENKQWIEFQKKLRITIKEEGET